VVTTVLDEESSNNKPTELKAAVIIAAVNSLP